MLALRRFFWAGVGGFQNDEGSPENEDSGQELDHMTDDYDKTIKDELAELMKRVEELTKTIAKTRCKCAESDG